MTDLRTSSLCFVLCLGLLTVGCNEPTGTEKAEAAKPNEAPTESPENAEGAAEQGNAAPEELSVSTDIEAEKRDIRAVWEGYRNATLAGDGEAALALVASTAIARYDRVRALAVAGSKGERLEEVRESSIGDRLMIAMMLLRLGEARLAELDGRGLYALGIQQGWIGQKSFREGGMGEVTIMENGMIATAPVTEDGALGEASWRFVKEGGVWKVDLTALMNYADIKMAELAKAQKITEDQLIKKFIDEMDPGTIVARDNWQVWSPPDGSFSMAMPLPPQDVSRPDSTQTMYIAQSSQDSTAYMVGWDIDHAGETDNVLDNAIGGLVTGSNGEVVRVREGERDGLILKQVEIKLPDDMVFHARVFMQDKRLYTLSMVGKKGLDRNVVEKFFDSFERSP